jgi:hypothetical protein
MWMTFALGITTGLVAAWLVWVVTGFSEPTGTPAPRGARSSPPPLPTGISLPSNPSFERSATNSSVSVTLQVSPDPPLVYTVEPVSGGWPWHRLTVHFVPSPDDLGLPTLPSDAFGSNSPAAPSSPEPGTAAWLDLQDERPLL